MSVPWAPGTASGVGSMPGTDPVEAVRLVLGDLPALPFLPELPARGPHADLTGRSAAVLVDLPVDLDTGGWRLTDRVGRDGRVAKELLAQDLDALEEAAVAAAPPLLKVQVAGPWTLAATLETRRGGAVLADHGAVRDLAESLAEGVRLHLADVARRTGATVLLQVDEPMLPGVLRGSLAGAGLFGRLAAVEADRASAALALVLAASPYPIVHCCADDVPAALLVRAGARALSLDAGRISSEGEEELVAAVEDGAGLLLGLVPTSGPGDADAATATAQRLRRRWGLGAERFARAVVVTPACGLAGAAPHDARQRLAGCVTTARRLVEAA